MVSPAAPAMAAQGHLALFEVAVAVAVATSVVQVAHTQVQILVRRAVAVVEAILFPLVALLWLLH